jgi:hypothetical protein
VLVLLFLRTSWLSTSFNSNTASRKNWVVENYKDNLVRNCTQQDPQETNKSTSDNGYINRHVGNYDKHHNDGKDHCNPWHYKVNTGNNDKGWFF